MSNISLEEFGNFAESIGFIATKNKDGVFIYKNKESKTELKPYELGNLYKLCNLKYSEGIKDSLNTLEFYIKKSKTQKELSDNLNKFIIEMKQTCKLCNDKLKS